MPDGLLGVGWMSMRAGFSQPLDPLVLGLYKLSLGIKRQG